MSEQKREPKAGEWWWCQVLFEKELHCILRISGSAMEGLIWDTNGEYYNEDIHPIAIVASHELVREMVEAVNAGRIALSNRDRNDLDEAAYKMLRFVLVKAELAGLEANP